MKPLQVHVLAEQEMASAIDYYKAIRHSLGSELQTEIKRSLAKVQSRPALHPHYQDTNLRKCILKQFPYTIYFCELDQLIWIAAFAHHKRRQGYWSQRSPGD